MLLRVIYLVVFGMASTVLISCSPQQFSRDQFVKKDSKKADEFRLISPDKIAVNSYHQLGVSGGKAPYTIEILEGPGLVNNAFILMAENAKGTIRVRAIDGENTERYAVVNVMDECDLGQTCEKEEIDMEPPAVEIVDPPAKAKCKKDVDVDFTVADNVGVTKVECYLDGNLVTDKCVSPFTIENIQKGTRKVLIKAYDEQGNTTEEEIEIKVDCC